MMRLPPLDIDNVNIFLLNINNTCIGSVIETDCLNMLTNQEKCRYHNFQFDKDRHLYLLSHAMLRSILSQYIGCSTHEVSFYYNKYGKPFLTGYSGVSFNLSHSKKAVALVINKSNNLALGVDIEKFTNRGNVVSLAYNYFSKEEYKLLLGYPQHQRNEVFFKLWTLKESYIKAVGKGLSIDLNSFSFGSLENNIQFRYEANNILVNSLRFYQSNVYKEYCLALTVITPRVCADNLKVLTYSYEDGKSCVPLQITYLTSHR